MKMCKTLLLSTILLLVARAGQAQVHFGIKGGFAETYISDADEGRFTGFGGLFVNANLGYHWHLQPEVLYTGAGAVYGNGYYFYPNDPNNTTVSLGYVQVPVMLQYRFGPVFYLEFGPQVSFLTNSSYNTGGVKTSAGSDYNTTDFAIDFGAGLRLGPIVSLFARYELGLTDVYSNSGVPAGSSVASAYNRIYQFGLGITFPNGNEGGGGHRGRYYR
jgi:Outer membrane protein beta-barrel domain